MLHHADRGSQYLGDDDLKLLGEHGIQRSMCQTDNCYDNAAAGCGVALTGGLTNMI